MTKKILMASALGGVFLLGTACFGLFSKTSGDSEPSRVAACAGLSGQAKIDCERRQGQ